MQYDNQKISAGIWANRHWIPLALAIVENSGPVMGLSPEQTGRLAMAVEEIVMHLAQSVPGTGISMEIIPGGWHVTVQLSFNADPSTLWAMNLCTEVNVTEDPGLTNLGLLLAAKVTDRFSIRMEQEMVHLSLRKELDYPSVRPEPGERMAQKGELLIDADPDASVIKDACIRAVGRYDPEDLHQSFFHPGKVVDMVARNDLTVAVAMTRSREVAGAIFWKERGRQSMTFFGPYSFEDGTRCAGLLTEHMIQRAARTSALGIFSGRATSDLPPADFERLGALAKNDNKKSRQEDGNTIWYRHLGEDPGTAVWSHPDLEDFLKERYRALVLMRRIRPVQDLGEDLPERSVISTRLLPRLSEAVLIPLVGGRDMEICLKNHVQSLETEGYRTILFHIDLAYGRQAALAGPALAAGFIPRMVLPYGGRSDMVVLQYESL